MKNALYYSVVLAFCLWMWGRWTVYGDSSVKKWLVRTSAVFIAVAAGLALFAGSGGLALIEWHEYSAEEIAQARQVNRPVVIKFTADWCTNCAVVERKVYDREDIAGLIERKNVLAVKADTTIITNKATVDFKRVYNEAGNVPVTIVILPDETMIKLRGIFNAKELIDILTALADRDTAGGKESS